MPDKSAPSFDPESTRPISPNQVLEQACDAHRLQATLTVLRGPKEGTVYQLQGDRTVIGRSSEADLQLMAEGISRRHAQIVHDGDRYLLIDLGSTNGTVCHGRWVEGPVELKEGDRINLGGSVVLRFSLEGELEQQLRARLYELATRDPLTMACNRRFLQERMSSEWPWARRHGKPCALLMIDIDHFKQVNDSWGHLAGDQVLKDLVQLMGQTMRREDVLARLGGEEFAVLCRATERREALCLAERLRRQVMEHDFVWKDSPIKITICVGVATSDESEVETTEALMALADRRLYAAKRMGRNRVEPQA